jgi:hypothetical protein
MTGRAWNIRYVAAGVVLGLGGFLAGCSSLTSSAFQNAQVNQEIRNGRVVYGTGPGPVTRFDTPGNFPAIVRTCAGTEGLYVSEASTGFITVVPDDPGCGARAPGSAAGGAGAPQQGDGK